MGAFNFWMIVVGLLVAKGDVLRRVYSSDPRMTSRVIKFTPVADFFAPFVLVMLALLCSRTFEYGRHSDDRYFSDALLILGLLVSFAASAVGVFALMLLFVGGSIGRDGWQQPAIRRTLVFACLDVLQPILLIAFMVVVVLTSHAISG